MYMVSPSTTYCCVYISHTTAKSVCERAELTPAAAGAAMAESDKIFKMNFKIGVE
jgi:hypothetical protein